MSNPLLRPRVLFSFFLYFLLLNFLTEAPLGAGCGIKNVIIRYDNFAEVVSR